MSSPQSGSFARARPAARGQRRQYDVALPRPNIESLHDTSAESIAYQNALRALKPLLGRYPAAAVAIAEQLPAWPARVPEGLPSELLERRPDVIATERRVAAAFYRTEEAEKAARLPRISLVELHVAQSSSSFLKRDNRSSAPAPSCAAIFLGGLLQAGRRAHAGQRAAIADYGKVRARVRRSRGRALGGYATERQILGRAVRERARVRWRTFAIASARSTSAPCSGSSSPFTRPKSRSCGAIEAPRATSQPSSRAGRKLRASPAPPPRPATPRARCADSL